MANKWLAHVKKTMKSHKGKKFGDILKMAKKTYKGGAEGSVEPKSDLPSPTHNAAPVGGRRRSRRSRKTRRGGMGMMGY
jgi:hypothetical protein